ncbi:MAG: hypothetical protein M1817_006449 [Caeruleum heppii]|nr:MAG: hypothetical protein M1817_006449 [Caeruleum heppii]
MLAPRGGRGGRGNTAPTSFRGSSRGRGAPTTRARGTSIRGRGSSNRSPSPNTQNGPSSDTEGRKPFSNRTVRFGQVDQRPAHSRTPSNMNDYYATLKKNREKERAHAIANNLVDDPNRQRRLEDAITFVGTCQDMCPEFERVERIVRQAVDSCEKTHGVDGQEVPEQRLMVKRFRRSAAGDDAQLPSDVRPPPILTQTLDYLIDEVVGGPQPLAKVHAFVWDRTRSIRNDFTLQNVQGARNADLKLAIACYERIARFHIHSLHELCRPDIDDQGFTAHNEREQLNKTLLSLMEFYDLCAFRKIECQNEAEFRAYNIIMHFHDQDIEREAQNLGCERPEVYNHPRVQKALELYAAAGNTTDNHGPLKPNGRTPIAQNNVGHFFRLVHSSQFSYTMACVAEIHFNHIRKVALSAIRTAYRSPATQQDCTLGFLTDMLGFDDGDQTWAFCEACGMEFADGRDGEAYLVLSSGGSQLTDPNNTLKQPFSENVVEHKRHGRTLPHVINGLTVRQARAAGGINLIEAEKAAVQPNSIVPTAPIVNMGQPTAPQVNFTFGQPSTGFAGLGGFGKPASTSNSTDATPSAGPTSQQAPTQSSIFTFGANSSTSSSSATPPSTLFGQTNGVVSGSSGTSNDQTSQSLNVNAPAFVPPKSVLSQSTFTPFGSSNTTNPTTTAPPANPFSLPSSSQKASDGSPINPFATQSGHLPPTLNGAPSNPFSTTASSITAPPDAAKSFSFLGAAAAKSQPEKTSVPKTFTFGMPDKMPGPTTQTDPVGSLQPSLNPPISATPTTNVSGFNASGTASAIAYAKPSVEDSNSPTSTALDGPSTKPFSFPSSTLGTNKPPKTSSDDVGKSASTDPKGSRPSPPSFGFLSSKTNQTPSSQDKPSATLSTATTSSERPFSFLAPTSTGSPALSDSAVDFSKPSSASTAPTGSSANIFGFLNKSSSTAAPATQSSTTTAPSTLFSSLGTSATKSDTQSSKSKSESLFVTGDSDSEEDVEEEAPASKQVQPQKTVPSISLGKHSVYFAPTVTSASPSPTRQETSVRVQELSDEETQPTKSDVKPRNVAPPPTPRPTNPTTQRESTATVKLTAAEKKQEEASKEAARWYLTGPGGPIETATEDLISKVVSEALDEAVEEEAKAFRHKKIREHYFFRWKEIAQKKSLLQRAKKSRQRMNMLFKEAQQLKQNKRKSMGDVAIGEAESNKKRAVASPPTASSRYQHQRSQTMGRFDGAASRTESPQREQRILSSSVSSATSTRQHPSRISTDNNPYNEVQRRLTGPSDLAASLPDPNPRLPHPRTSIFGSSKSSNTYLSGKPIISPSIHYNPRAVITRHSSSTDTIKSDYWRLKAAGLTRLRDGSTMPRAVVEMDTRKKRALEDADDNTPAVKSRLLATMRAAMRSPTRFVRTSIFSTSRTGSSRGSPRRSRTPPEDDDSLAATQAPRPIPSKPTTPAPRPSTQPSQTPLPTDAEDEALFAELHRLQDAMDEGIDFYRDQVSASPASMDADLKDMIAQGKRSVRDGPLLGSSTGSSRLREPLGSGGRGAKSNVPEGIPSASSGLRGLAALAAKDLPPSQGSGMGMFGGPTSSVGLPNGTVGGGGRGGGRGGGGGEVIDLTDD